jgi:hypothetical protein
MLERSPFGKEMFAATIQNSLQAGGYATVSEFFRAHPGKTCIELARILGPNIIPQALLALYYREAKQEGRMRDAACDNLVRELHYTFPQGWGIHERPDEMAGVRLAGWVSDVVNTGECPQYEPFVMKVMTLLIRESPPGRGWHPVGIEDEYLTELFNRAWPESDKEKDG